MIQIPPIGYHDMLLRLILPKLMFAVTLLAVSPILGGCQSQKDYRVYWPTLHTFSPGAPQAGKIRVEWKNPVGEAAFNDLKTKFETVAKDAGFEITQNLNEADYVYCLSLRFFGVNPKQDTARQVLDRAGNVIKGGYKGWIIEGEGEDNQDRTVTVVELDRADQSMFEQVFSSDQEYCILLDVAIGERHRTADGGEGSLYRLDARLVGWQIGLAETREQAVELFNTKVGENLKQILP